MKITELDVNRLKWRVIETVSKFFEEYYSEDASDLEESFTRQYEMLLQQHDTNDVSENSKLHHLIIEFKPALESVLQPGEQFDRLMGIIGPILNTALSRIEGMRIQSTASSKMSPRTYSEPKIRTIPLYDSATSLQLLSVGIDIGSSTSHALLEYTELLARF